MAFFLKNAIWGQVVNFIRKFVRRAMAPLILACLAHPAAAEAENLGAFEGFVANGQYRDANFYLANGFLSASDIDTGQLFYSVLDARFGNDIRRNIRGIDELYNYLAALGPIDLNRTFSCRTGTGADTCLLVNDLIVNGVRPNDLAWFVARGLDLNKREADFIPATVPLMVRFGSHYSLNDLNWFSGNGMVLGDENYTIEELINYRDPHVAYDYGTGRPLKVPSNFLNLGDQNFLDVLVMVLASDTDINPLQQSRRREALCNFITYAAAAYTPSFDYLQHVLDEVGDFRGANIGKQERGNGGVYAPFPTACVSLVQAMAVSHARLNQVIDNFARTGDVQTASWLLSLTQVTPQ